jgi:hypothetical protein
MGHADQVETDFRALHPGKLEDLPVTKAFALLLRFYDEYRPTGAMPLDEDGDMLLYEWGTYNWGNGRSFNLSLTRQVLYPDGEHDQAVWQLRLIFKYPAEPDLDALKSGSAWLHDPSGMTEFRSGIFDSASFAACSRKSPLSTEVVWGQQ